MPRSAPRRLAATALLLSLGLAASAPPAPEPAAGGSGAEPPLPPRHLLTRPIPDDVANAEQLRRGQYLVRASDCAACHTAPGGAPFAGGLGLNTPFGVIYSSNLTSDPQAGIGRTTPEAFYAALHHGRRLEGGPLYPAMPYAYFTRMSREDTDAMLAYLKTVPPAADRPPKNRLPFPFNIRALVRAWNLLYFRPGEFEPDPARSAEWNRGAYLVTGPGHCGACHTPKNVLGADKGARALWGGTLDNWTAPDLTGNRRTGLGQWSVEDVVEFLKTGRNAHANAGGPMADVVTDSTALMDEADLRAIAVYLKDQTARPADRPRVADPGALARGAQIYSDACASCHMADADGQPRLFPPLSDNALVQQADPSGVISIVLGGSRTAPTPTRPTPASMPSFAWKLDDQQIADVATYVRSTWGNRAEPVSPRQVGQLRKARDLHPAQPTDGAGGPPPR